MSYFNVPSTDAYRESPYKGDPKTKASFRNYKKRLEKMMLNVPGANRKTRRAAKRTISSCKRNMDRPQTIAVEVSEHGVVLKTKTIFHQKPIV